MRCAWMAEEATSKIGGVWKGHPADGSKLRIWMGEDTLLWTCIWWYTFKLGILLSHCIYFDNTCVGLLGSYARKKGTYSSG